MILLLVGFYYGSTEPVFVLLTSDRRRRLRGADCCVLRSRSIFLSCQTSTLATYGSIVIDQRTTNKNIVFFFVCFSTASSSSIIILLLLILSRSPLSNIQPLFASLYYCNDHHHKTLTTSTQKMEIPHFFYTDSRPTKWFGGRYNYYYSRFLVLISVSTTLLVTWSLLPGASKSF